MAISLNSPKYADVNSLAYQMHKKQKDRKKRKSLLSYFRLNEGGTDRVDIPDFTATADFDISVDVLLTEIQSYRVFIGSSQTNIGINMAVDNTGKFRCGTGNAWILSNQPYQLGKFYRLRLTAIGSTVRLYVNGVQNGTANRAAGNLTARTITQSIAGVCSNASFKGDLLPERFYPINSNTNDVPDTVSGIDGTIINGNTNDWGLFKEQPTLWKGQNLTVPPWGSVDQELIKA